MPPALAQLAVLVAVAAAIVWPAPINPARLPGVFVTSDLVVSHWPSALLIKETVASAHRLPLWNPYYGGGRPLAADPLAALWYPPTHLVHFLTVRNYLLTMEMGHLVLAGAGMLVLGRAALRLSPLAALVAAVAYMATPRLIGHLGVGHLTLVQAAAWLPWVAAACWATVRDPARWAVPLGGCLALLLLAGHPQVAYYGFLMVAAIALWGLAARWRTDGRRALSGAVLGLAAAGLLALLLAAVHLVPLREFMAHSTREQAIRAGDKYPPLTFLKALVGIRTPSANPFEDLVEPGWAVLALAALGVARRPRAGLPLLLGVALVAGLAMGTISPVYQAAARLLPDFDRFRGLSRVWLVALVGIALVAGLGADVALAAVRRRTIRGAALAGLLLIALVGVSLVRTDRRLPQPTEPWQEVQDAVDATRPSDFQQMAAQAAGTGRIYGMQRNMGQLTPTLDGVEVADGWDPLLIQPYAAFMQRAGGYTFAGYQLSIPPYEVSDPGYATSRPDAQPDAGLLALVDVRIVITWDAVQLTDPRFYKLGEMDGAAIYRNDAVTGRAYLVAPGPDGVPPSIDGLQRIDASVQEVERSPERQTFAFTAPADGYLTIGSPAYPGWTATLDGRPAPVRTIEGVLPAVRVGPGAHRLTYAYEPRSLRLGAALSLLGLAAALGWPAGRWLWRRRRATSPRARTTA